MVNLSGRVESLTAKELQEKVLEDGPLKLGQDHELIQCPEFENSVCLISFVENPVTGDTEAVCGGPLFKENQTDQHSSCKYSTRTIEE